jgi:DNA-directed RNA polymerase specialized sigma24 family protein
MTTKTTLTSMTIAMIHHADVVRPIKTTLRSFGVKAQDLEDGVAEVQTRTLEYLRGKPLPASTEEWVALCVTVAKNWRMKEDAKGKTAKKYCVGLCEDPDEHIGLERAVEAYERVDAKRMVEVLQQQFDAGEMPEKGDEILDCIQAGLGYQKTAAELGISAEAVRKRLKRMRELFEARLAALGMTVTVVMLTMAVAGSAMAAPAAEPSAPSQTVLVPPPRPTPRPMAA